mgnify:CR=1 FL=1|jgi:hypothetical protein
MRMNLAIEMQDGKTQEVTASAPDIVKFEEKFNISISKLEKEMKLTHLFFLAYSALKRQGKTDLEFDAWLETIEGIGVSQSNPK